MTGRVEFLTTTWSVLLGGPTDDQCRAAWEHLGARYWRPVYALYRRAHGVPAPEAKDLVQSLFLRLMEGRLTTVDRERARFRAWLRVVARNHLADQRRLRRETGAFTPPQWATELAGISDPDFEAASPDEVFDRACSLAEFDAALARFEAACAASDLAHHALAIRLRYLESDRTRGAAARVAAELGISPPKASRLLYRAKQGFRHHLVAVLRETLTAEEADDPAIVDREIEALRANLAA